MGTVLFMRPSKAETVDTIEAAISDEIRFIGLAETYFQNRLSELYRMQDYLLSDEATVPGFRERFGRPDATSQLP